MSWSAAWGRRGRSWRALPLLPYAQALLGEIHPPEHARRDDAEVAVPSSPANAALAAGRFGCREHLVFVMLAQPCFPADKLLVVVRNEQLDAALGLAAGKTAFGVRGQ